MQQRREHAEDQAEPESYVRDKDEQPGQDADRHRKLQARYREPQRIVHGEHAHDRELTPQELCEHAIDLAGDAADARQPPARQETVHARDDPIPVTQQVEHHDRNQREIDENAEDDRASRLQARQELESQHLCAVEVVRDQFLDRSQVDLQLDAEGLAQPGCKPAVEVGGELGKAAHELPDLALDQRYENDQQREDQQQND